MPTITIPMPASAFVNLSDPVVKVLHGCIANSMALCQILRAAHWGLVSREFFSLHEAFGDQYEALFESVDWFAERIRALGSHVDSTYLYNALPMSGIEGIQTPMECEAIIRALLTAHEKNIRDLSNAARIAKETGDTVTENALLTYIEAEQKTTWMLRSCIA